MSGYTENPDLDAELHELLTSYNIQSIQEVGEKIMAIVMRERKAAYVDTIRNCLRDAKEHTSLADLIRTLEDRMCFLQRGKK